MKFILLSLVLLTPFCNIHAQTLEGTWQNELGSILVVDSVSSTGAVSGEYHSSSGVDGRVFPLQGWTNKSDPEVSVALSFTVHWGTYGSITSWTGFLDRDEQGPYIKTVWHLVRPNEPEPWERIITNASTFRPTKAIKR